MTARAGTRTPRVLAIDAGGTMTDTFIVDERGEFVVGKAQTTPEDESRGFLASAGDALRQWDRTPDDSFGEIVSGVFSGTAMLNRLLTRTGLDVGLVVTAGHEDMLRMERAIQTYLGYSYADRLHVATHHHNPPLVPRTRIHGVRGRIDGFGGEALPLREEDARNAAHALLDDGVQAICISFMNSFRNPVHEERAAAIVDEARRERGLDSEVPVFVSSRLYPIRRDLPRLNTTVVEAYAAEPSRATLRRVAARTADHGARFDLRVMAGHGGTVGIDATQLATTLVSGPVGGVVGATWLAERIGLDNVLCTDIGGTSFDIALVTDGAHEVAPDPDVGRLLLTTTAVKLDSVGAGTGSFVRVDPRSRRPEIGPDSAGSRIGTCWPDGGVDTITVTDLNLVLGRLNPDYFLGGDLDLDMDRARFQVRRQLSDPLGLGVEEAAAGVIELFESALGNEAASRILGKGYAPGQYALLCYGGGGPLHVAGYSKGVPYRDVLIPSWAAGFSAFGCACAHFEYRYDQTIDLPLLPSQTTEQRAGLGGLITAAWQALREKVAGEFTKVGHARDTIAFDHLVRMQYFGQLIDIEVVSPHAVLGDADDLEDLVRAFEATYAKLYARSAQSSELGHLVTTAVVRGRVDVEKPRLPELEPTPGAPVLKGTRPVHWGSGFVTTDLYEMTDVGVGQTVEGPAVVEAEATTLAIPPDRRARLDRHGIFHLETKEG